MVHKTTVEPLKMHSLINDCGETMSSNNYAISLGHMREYYANRVAELAEVSSFAHAQSSALNKLLDLLEKKQVNVLAVIAVTADTLSVEFESIKPIGLDNIENKTAVKVLIGVGALNRGLTYEELQDKIVLNTDDVRGQFSNRLKANAPWLLDGLGLQSAVSYEIYSTAGDSQDVIGIYQDSDGTRFIVTTSD